MTIGTWNIRRGLIKRENEIINLLSCENLDVLFLTETDTQFSSACSYNIKGFTTHVQLCEKDDDIVRIIALTKDNCGVDFNLRNDLMSKAFPSIWIEVLDKFKSKSLLGGFYR